MPPKSPRAPLTHRARPPAMDAVVQLRRRRRLYAHVLSLTCACPRCGKVLGAGTAGRRAQAYDAATGGLRCPCGYRALVGVLLWPVRRRAQLPHDHILTPGEAAELRLHLSETIREDIPQPRRARGEPTNCEREEITTDANED